MGKLFNAFFNLENSDKFLVYFFTRRPIILVTRDTVKTHSKRFSWVRPGLETRQAKPVRSDT
jgi:hypothetical protein